MLDAIKNQEPNVKITLDAIKTRFLDQITTKILTEGTTNF